MPNFENGEKVLVSGLEFTVLTRLDTDYTGTIYLCGNGSKIKFCYESDLVETGTAKKDKKEKIQEGDIVIQRGSIYKWKVVHVSPDDTVFLQRMIGDQTNIKNVERCK